MREVGKNALLSFQKELIISCTSLLELHQYLKQHHNMQYLMTHRLNQDVLEHFFGCLRQAGGSNYQHPSPVEVKYRVRSYILGENTDFFGCNSNFETSNTDTTLDASLSESFFSSNDTVNTGNQKLDDELMLSALVFTACDFSGFDDASDPQTDEIP